MRAFDAANAEDPNTEVVGGVERPRELVQAERRAAWVERLDPNASEALRLAARCQHIRRWQIPRRDYPEGRRGYLEWRAELARFHAAASRAILAEAGYDEDVVAQVERINLKKGLRRDPDTQTMEDALCLAFLEHELAAFAEKHDEAKVVAVLHKTWKKMSDPAKREALDLPLPAPLRALVERALEEP